jgi:hypothetical protein
VDQNKTISIGSNKIETVTQAMAESITLGKALSIGGAYQKKRTCHERGRIDLFEWCKDRDIGQAVHQSGR